MQHALEAAKPAEELRREADLLIEDLLESPSADADRIDHRRHARDVSELRESESHRRMVFSAAHESIEQGALRDGELRGGRRRRGELVAQFVRECAPDIVERNVLID